MNLKATIPTASCGVLRGLSRRFIIHWNLFLRSKLRGIRPKFQYEKKSESMSKKKAIVAVILVALIVALSIGAIFMLTRSDDGYRKISIKDVLWLTSKRNQIEDAVLVSDQQPMLGLVATPVSCWYNIAGTDENGTDTDLTRHGLRPLLFVSKGGPGEAQLRFIENAGPGSLLFLGSVEFPGSSGFKASGRPSDVSVAVAGHAFSHFAGALLVEDTQEGYELGVVAAPMASYLNIPVIVTDDTTDIGILRSFLRSSGAEYVIVLGQGSESMAGLLGFKSIIMKDTEEINKNALTVIQNRFGRIDYITMTNPSDVVPPSIASSETEVFDVEVDNLKLKTDKVDMDIIGESTTTLEFNVDAGVNWLQIYVNFTRVDAEPLDPMKEAIEIEPLIFAYLYDPQGRLASYAPSYSLDVGKDYLSTQTFECPGKYSLVVNVYYGIRGFDTYAGTQLGISRIQAAYEVKVVRSLMRSPHLPLYPGLSQLAPYLTASHGGIVLADPSFEQFDANYAAGARGYATGPWYEPALFGLVNGKVDHIVSRLNATVESFKEFGLYDAYFNGSSWLAILAGPDMVPHYYVAESADYVDDVIYGKGWPTDTRYSMDLKLSVGRPLGQDVGDASALIARTLFYEPYAQGHAEMITQEYGSSEDWGKNFHFLAGELGGRTGWFFWQRTFSTEVQSAGFSTEEYFQNKDNDRQTMLIKGAYERANYFDLMVHGNWYWYTPEINGVDTYSTSVKNSDVFKASSDWELGPSVFISGSCLLGRMDGIPPHQSITLALIHAGINAIFSAARSTGNEAKAGTIERGLIYDDISIGQAIRADKVENTLPPAALVRMLFGDPAFDPYEPQNGYGAQGRPTLV